MAAGRILQKCHCFFGFSEALRPAEALSLQTPTFSVFEQFRCVRSCFHSVLVTSLDCIFRVYILQKWGVVVTLMVFVGQAPTLVNQSGPLFSVFGHFPKVFCQVGSFYQATNQSKEQASFSF